MRALALGARRRCATWARAPIPSSPQQAGAPSEVTLVESVDDARWLLDALSSPRRRSSASAAAAPYAAWRAEVADWAPSTGQPVESGDVIGVAAFLGTTPFTHLGRPLHPRVFVDNLAPGRPATLLRDFFADPSSRKVFHSATFHARALAHAAGLPRVDGVLGDTLRMGWMLGARGLSLPALSKRFCPQQHASEDVLAAFGVPGTSAGSPPGALVLPDVRGLQTDPSTRARWIEHSLRSSEATWHLYGALAEHLRRMPWAPDAALGLPPWGTGEAERGVGAAAPGGGATGPHTPRAPPPPPPLTQLDAYAHLVLPASLAAASIEEVGFAVSAQAAARVLASAQRMAGLAVANGPSSSPSLPHPLPAPSSAADPLALGGFGAPLLPSTSTALFPAGTAQQPPAPPLPPIPSAAAKEFLRAAAEPLAAVPDGSRMHPALNLNTNSGRLLTMRPLLTDRDMVYRSGLPAAVVASSSSPQNNLLISVRYECLDLSVAAHLSRCPALASDLREVVAGGGVETVHHRTARALFRTPSPSHLHLARARDLDEGIPHGRTSVGFAQAWACAEAEADELVRRWIEARPAVWAWMGRSVESARASGGSVRSLGGRLRLVDGLATRAGPTPKVAPWQWSHAERTAAGAPLVAGSADLHERALVRMCGEEGVRGLGFRPVLSAWGDEVVLEGPAAAVNEAETALATIALAPFGPGSSLSVPLLVRVGRGQSWDEAFASGRFVAVVAGPRGPDGGNGHHPVSPNRTHEEVSARGPDVARRRGYGRGTWGGGR
jgi:hypothetical protein